MDFYDFWYNLKKHWWLVLLLVVLIAGLTFTLSIIQTLKYRSTVQLLVGQKYQPGIDTYTATKSAEYLSNLLSEVVYSSSFMKETLNNPRITDDYDQSPLKRKKEWLKTVKTKVISDTGIIVIDAYHKNKNQAAQLAQAVADVLITKSNLYHGQGDQVFIRLIDYPITTDYPVKPNVILNTVFGLILGLLIGLLIVYLLTAIEDKLYLEEKGKIYPLSGLTASEATDYQEDDFEV